MVFLHGGSKHPIIDYFGHSVQSKLGWVKYNWLLAGAFDRLQLCCQGWAQHHLPQDCDCRSFSLHEVLGGIIFRVWPNNPPWLWHGWNPWSYEFLLYRKVRELNIKRKKIWTIISLIRERLKNMIYVPWNEFCIIWVIWHFSDGFNRALLKF